MYVIGRPNGYSTSMSKKCKCMYLGIMNNGHEYYMLDDRGHLTLDKITEKKDLGVWTSNSLKSEKQCHAAVSKATSALKLLKLSFQHLDRKFLLMLYRTYVRVHLEHCIQHWSPHYVKDIKHLEKIQRRATKQIPGLKNKSCPS